MGKALVWKSDTESSSFCVSPECMPLKRNHNMDLGDNNSPNLFPQGVVHAVDPCSQ